MAHVNFDGLNLRVTLTMMEKWAALRGDVVIPRANLASVEFAPRIWERMRHGIAPMGVGHKGLLFIGGAFTPQGTDFCVLGRGGPGLVVNVRDNTYARLLLSVPEPDLWPLFARLREVTMGAAPNSADRSG